MFCPAHVHSKPYSPRYYHSSSIGHGLTEFNIIGFMMNTKHTPHNEVVTRARLADINVETGSAGVESILGTVLSQISAEDCKEHDS